MKNKNKSTYYCNNRIFNNLVYKNYYTNKSKNKRNKKIINYSSKLKRPTYFANHNFSSLRYHLPYLPKTKKIPLTPDD